MTAIERIKEIENVEPLQPGDRLELRRVKQINEGFSFYKRAFRVMMEIAKEKQCCECGDQHSCAPVDQEFKKRMADSGKKK